MANVVLKLKVSMVGVNSSVSWEFSVVVMATAVKNKSKTAKKSAFL